MSRFFFLLAFVFLVVSVARSAPSPRLKHKKKPYFPGVYKAVGLSHDAILWFAPDGTYGSRWAGSIYEGKWHTKNDDKIYIMERRIEDYNSPLYPWVISQPGASTGWFALKLVHNLPETK
jgi:hypothetical protein